MQVYKLSSAEFEKLKKKILWGILPIMLVILTILVITQSINPKTGEVNITMLLVVIAVFAGVGGFSLYRILNKQKQVYDSYRLTVHDNLIIREQLNLPRVEIYVNEISSLTKTTDNQIIIKGKNPQDIIYIPSQLENYEDLQKRLDEIMLIAPAPQKSFFQRYPFLVLLMVFALMIISIGSLNLIVALLCGVPAVAAFLYAFFKGITHKSLDSRTKRSLWSMWIMIILVIVSLIYKLMYLEWY